jgi:hypothetical protein
VALVLGATVTIATTLSAWSQASDAACVPASQVTSDWFAVNPVGRETAVALLVGSDYRRLRVDGPVRPLDNAVRDAETMASLLRQRGYSTFCIADPTLEEFRSTLRMFRAFLIDLNMKRLNPRPLVYFAGHGGNSAQNVPVLVTSDVLPPGGARAFETLDLADVLARLPDTDTPPLVIIDACRRDMTNAQVRPFGAETDLPPPSFYRPTSTTQLVFSTGAGATAGDGTGVQNGPFVEALKLHLDGEGWDYPIDPRIRRMVDIVAAKIAIHHPDQRPISQVSGQSPLTPGQFWSPVEPPSTERQFIALMWLGSEGGLASCRAEGILRNYAANFANEPWHVRVDKRVEDLHAACTGFQNGAAVAEQQLSPDLSLATVLKPTLNSKLTSLTVIDEAGKTTKLQKNPFNEGDFKLLCEAGQCSRNVIFIEGADKKRYQVDPTGVEPRAANERYMIPVERANGRARSVARRQVTLDIAQSSDKRSFASLTVWIIDPRSDEPSLRAAMSDLYEGTLVHLTAAARITGADGAQVVAETDFRYLPKALGERYLPEKRAFCASRGIGVAADDLCLIVELVASRSPFMDVR